MAQPSSNNRRGSKRGKSVRATGCICPVSFRAVMMILSTALLCRQTFVSRTGAGERPVFFASAAKTASSSLSKVKASSTGSVDSIDTKTESQVFLNDGAPRRSNKDDDRVYRRLGVQIVHRHGDRTPITPLKDEAYWYKTLISQRTLENISSNTKILKSNVANTHVAGGRGPFGKLTELGLLQMIKLGSKLREDLCFENSERDEQDSEKNFLPYIFSANKPLSPSNIRVISTDFARTIQSVQGLLVGLFPDGTGDEVISIDTRHTDSMIPDPKPRRTKEQENLEMLLSKRPHITAKENEMMPLAVNATKALHDFLAPDAHEASFGVDRQHSGRSGSMDNGSDEDCSSEQDEMCSSIEIEPLSWNQLAEVTKCFAVRGLLPPEISTDMQEQIGEHAAWRWFQNLRHPRLAYLSMNKMVRKQVDYMKRVSKNHPSEPPMTIWSAHDSTLIGLMCAYRLEQPAVWPEYGSYLMIELLEVAESSENGEGKEVRKGLFVRFSLNGEVLKSQWDKENEPRELIPLNELSQRAHAEETIKAAV